MKTPYIGFSNNTLNKQPMLGPTAQCPKCGKDCKVENTEPNKTLQFINCCGTSYLVGIDGKDVTGVKADVSNSEKTPAIKIDYYQNLK